MTLDVQGRSPISSSKSELVHISASSLDRVRVRRTAFLERTGVHRAGYYRSRTEPLFTGSRNCSSRCCANQVYAANQVYSLRVASSQPSTTRDPLGSGFRKTVQSDTRFRGALT
jgi:hypothetical protein